MAKSNVITGIADFIILLHIIKQRVGAIRWSLIFKVWEPRYTYIYIYTYTKGKKVCLLFEYVVCGGEQIFKQNVYILIFKMVEIQICKENGIHVNIWPFHPFRKICSGIMCQAI